MSGPRDASGDAARPTASKPPIHSNSVVAALTVSPARDAPMHGNSSRMRTDTLFRYLCIATASVSVMILVFLLTSIILKGAPSLSWTLLTGAPAPTASEAGLRPAIFGSVWVCTLCALLTLPLGIGTAILLEEFQPRSRIASWVYSLIQLNIANLAGVPSVVYGILGLTAFVGMFGLFRQTDPPGAPAFEIGVSYYDQFFSEGDRAILVPVSDARAPMTTPQPGMVGYDFDMNPVQVHVIEADDPFPEEQAVLDYTLLADSEAGRISDKSWYYFRIPFGRGVLTGALTLMLVVLPVIIISTQEALRAVPGSLRAGALGLGATPWQVIWNVTLPAAIPGIMTGSILAMSRAIGETAPILIIAGILFILNSPRHLMDDFTVMPLQIYNWTSRPQADFHGIAAAAIIILLLILLSFNAIAVLIRHKMQKPLS